MKKLFTLALLGVISASSFATTFVEPPAFEFADANASFALSSTSTARRFQLLIAASELTAYQGMEISSIEFRLNASATTAWPSVNTSYAFFDIFMGQGVAPGSRTTIFANNYIGSLTQVRSGGLNVAANAFTAGSSPNAWGPAITFNTNYLYAGGDLIVDMQFANHVGATNQPSLDAANSTSAGYGTQYAATWGSLSSSTTTTSNSNFLVSRFTANAVPEPATMIGLGAAIAAVAARRRRKSA